MSHMIYQDVFLSVYFQHLLVIYLNNVFIFILKILLVVLMIVLTFIRNLEKLLLDF